MHTGRITLNQKLTNVRLIGVSRRSSSVGDASAPTATPIRPASPASQQAMPAPTAPTADDGSRQMIEAVFASLDEQITEIESRRQQSLDELQQVAVDLAVSIASRLIHEAIQADQFGVENMVQQMLSQFESNQPVEIRLNPADLQLLERRLEGRPPPWQKHASYRLVPDAQLPRGDCRIETADFGLMSRIELQLSEIRHHLLENLDDAQVERRKTETGHRGIRRFPDRREA